MKGSIMGDEVFTRQETYKNPLLSTNHLQYLCNAPEFFSDRRKTLESETVWAPPDQPSSGPFT